MLLVIFVILVFMGHAYMALAILAVYLQVFKEIMALNDIEELGDKSFIRYVVYYNLLSGVFASVPYFIKQSLASQVIGRDSFIFSALYKYHLLICMMMFMISLIIMVLSMTKYGNFEY